MLFFGKRFDHLFPPFSGEYQDGGRPILCVRNGEVMVFLTHISVALLLLLFLSSMFSACDTTSSQDTSAPSPVTTKTQPTATPRITQGIPAKVSLGDELAAFIA